MQKREKERERERKRERERERERQWQSKTCFKQPFTFYVSRLFICFRYLAGDPSDHAHIRARDKRRGAQDAAQAEGGRLSPQPLGSGGLLGGETLFPCLEPFVEPGTDSNLVQQQKDADHHTVGSGKQERGQKGAGACPSHAAGSGNTESGCEGADANSSPYKKMLAGSDARKYHVQTGPVDTKLCAALDAAFGRGERVSSLHTEGNLCLARGGIKVRLCAHLLYITHLFISVQLMASLPVCHVHMCCMPCLYAYVHVRLHVCLAVCDPTRTL